MTVFDRELCPFDLARAFFFSLAFSSEEERPLRRAVQISREKTCLPPKT